MSESVAQDQIRAFVERIERLDEELKAINDDKKEIFAEAKGNGFDVPALKQVLKIRRQDANERLEREAIVELYMSALGMIATPDFDEPRVQVQARVREASNSAAQITETQSRPTAGSDLTSSPSLNGQVAPLSPETANNVGEAQKVERRSPKPEDAGSIPAADANKIDFRKALRPHCLKPHSCGGMGREHCWSCKKAMNAAGAA